MLPDDAIARDDDEIYDDDCGGKGGEEDGDAGGDRHSTKTLKLGGKKVFYSEARILSAHPDSDPEPPKEFVPIQI